jgi:hypothetical protein
MFGAMERMTRVLRAADHPELLSDGLLALALTVFAQLNLRFNIDQSVHYGPGSPPRPPRRWRLRR